MFLFNPEERSRELAQQLRNAMLVDSIQKISSILQSADPNRRVDGTTPLAVAVELGPPRRLEVVKLLLNAKANPNTESLVSDLPLITASRKGDLEIVEALIACGAEVNRCNRFNNSALMVAAQGGYITVVRHLLEKGADVNVVGNNGRSALDYVEKAEIKQLLLSAGAKSGAEITASAGKLQGTTLSK